MAWTVLPLMSADLQNGHEYESAYTFGVRKPSLAITRIALYRECLILFQLVSSCSVVERCEDFRRRRAPCVPKIVCNGREWTCCYRLQCCHQLQICPSWQNASISVIHWDNRSTQTCPPMRILWRRLMISGSCGFKIHLVHYFTSLLVKKPIQAYYCVSHPWNSSLAQKVLWAEGIGEQHSIVPRYADCILQLSLPQILS